jgi:surface antigen
MNKSLATLLAATAVLAAPLAAVAPAQAQYGQPSGNPLASIFSCNTPGNRQGTGAVVGALVGGLAGNQIADNDRRSGTVIGALVGAAAGSMIGCKMQTQDQQRAQAVTQQALASGVSQSWNNPQTGASGRVDIVNTFNYGGPQNYQGGYQGDNGYNQAYNARPTVNTVRYAQDVERPREFQPSEGVYSATGNVVIRSGPSKRARQLGSLRNGETFDGLVRVEGTDWVLAMRDGLAIGYVSETNTRFMGDSYAQNNSGYNNNYNNGGYNNASPYQPYDARRGQMCRVFDQTFTYNTGQSETQRYTACQRSTGEWVVQA